MYHQENQSNDNLFSGDFSIPGDSTRKIPVAVLGATGSVGQRMVEMLAHHPWFEVVQLTASDRSAGKRYDEAVHWLLPVPIPENIRSMEITSCEKLSNARVAFSALDAHVAGDIETEWAKQGVVVVSNARSHRMDPDVPLVIPEVNADHLALVQQQAFPNGGCIVANPNCATIGLAVALQPLVENFGVEKVSVTTFQSTSGAGYPGVPSLAILDNIVPYISGEEEKIEREPLKIFSRFDGKKLHPPSMIISASCARVPITEGHLEAVSISLKKEASIDAVKQAFLGFMPLVSRMGLPTAPSKPVHFFDAPDLPQPRIHRFLEGGMAVAVGGLRPCPLFDYKFFVLSHNLIRGAAGGSILIGELLFKQKWIN